MSVDNGVEVRNPTSTPIHPRLTPKGKKVKIQNLKSPQKAKANVVAAVGGRPVATPGATHVARVAGPTAATNNTISATSSIYGIITAMLAVGISSIYVLAPFPYVTAHVIYA